jgi:hypothetical protein
MPWSVAAAAIGAAGALGGGAMGKSGAQKAGAQQAAAQQKALAYQEQVHDTAAGQFAPFIQGGTNALGAIGQLLGINIPGSGYTGNALDTYKSYTQTPFYQFPLQQGIEAADRSAAARGALLSPGQLAGVNKWGQGYASQNFKDYIGTLSNLAGIASGDIGTLSGQGNQAAGNVLTAQSGIGTAQAAGTTGATNSMTNALSQFAGLLGGGLKQFGSSYGTNGTNNPDSSRYFGSDYSYNPVAQGYSGDPNSAGGQALQSLGFFKPLSQ